MRKGILVTMYSVTFLQGYSQNQHKIDSLLALVVPNQLNEITAGIYLDIAREYKNSDSVNTFKYADQAIEIARAQELAAIWADANYVKGWSVMVLGSYSSAQVLFEKTLDLANQYDLQKGKANGFNGLGVLNTYQSNYYPALDYYLKSVEISSKIDHKEGIANCLNNIAIIYYYLGDNRSALDYSFQALEVKEMLGDERGIALSYNNIGYFYGTLNDYKNAGLYHEKAVEIRSRIGDKAGLAESYSNIGEALNGQSRFTEAKTFFIKSLTIYDSLGVQADKTYPLIGLGKSYAEQKEFHQAFDFLSEGLDLALASNFTSNVKEAAFELAQVQKELGDFEASLKTYELFHQASDSLRNEEQTKRITRLEDEFRFKEEQAAQQKSYDEEIKKRESTQQLSYYGLMASVLIIGIVFFFNAKLRRLNREVNKQKNDLEKLNATKNRFFSIISHDLRGPISNMIGTNELIEYHIRENYNPHGDQKLEEITSYVHNSSNQVLGLLDSLLKWALKEEDAIPYNPTSISVNQCISETCDLLAQQAANKKVKLNCAVETNITAYLDKNTFMTILRNLAGNSLKFTPEGGEVTISAEQQDLLVIKVQDDGVGMSEEKMENLFEINEQKVSKGTKGEQGTGLGLNLVHDFVKMNKGKIKVESRIGVGTTFMLTFPVKSR